MTAVARFWDKIELDGSCWAWTGGLGHNGYGQFEVDGHNLRAHRFSYETFVEPIPAGHQLDHLCRNRRCVRWSHLEPVLPRENIRRGTNHVARHMASSACPQGHPYSGTNNRGERICRICMRAAGRRSEREASGR